MKYIDENVKKISSKVLEVWYKKQALFSKS